MYCSIYRYYNIIHHYKKPSVQYDIWAIYHGYIGIWPSVDSIQDKNVHLGSKRKEQARAGLDELS